MRPEDGTPWQRAGGTHEPEEPAEPREFPLIRRIEGALGGEHGPEVLVSIGDDCAVIDPAQLRPGERLVWTIDAQVDGVHFRPELLSWEDVGYRATVAAASDLLAMGARPIAALVAWTIPSAFEGDVAEAIARGQRRAGDALGLSVIGGNIANAEALSLTTTALGGVTKPITRRGARPGDRVVAIGAFGEAALGFNWLSRGRSPDEAPRLVDAWRRPRILAAQARALGAVATAMIDVSDGLAQDCGHLARASGVRVRLELEKIAARRSEEAIEIARLVRAPLEHLELSGGEDYALVATVPADAPLPDEAFPIGVVEEGSGVHVVGRDGRPYAPPPGWSHG